MGKVKINMIGGGFQHDVCSTDGSIPKYIEWDKTGSSNISIHIDHAIQQAVNPIKKNYAWIAESSTIHPTLIDWVIKNFEYLENTFELIFTHDERLLLSDKFKMIKCGAVPWVKRENYKIYNKTKLISMISSYKTMCEEHIYRNNIRNKYDRLVDSFGNGFNYIKNKEQGLIDYCFSIAMENGTYPIMFSEKITDCFVTGTIPIYYGTSKINEVFNENGIILLDDNFSINDLSKELYYSKMEFILDNYERAINIETSEDYIYKNYIK